MRTYVILAGLILFTTEIALGAEHIVPGDFDTIQAAIDAAAPGDTVHVNAGVYRECVTLKSGIRLEGAGWESTVVECEPRSGAALSAYHVTDATVGGLSFAQLPLPEDSGWILFPNPSVMLFDSSVHFANTSMRNSVFHGAFVYGGSPRFENVQFVANAWSGVLVRGEESHPVFDTCGMHKNQGSGLALIGEHVNGEASNCVLESNGWYGIYLEAGATINGEGNAFTRNGMINSDEVHYLWNSRDFDQIEQLVARFRSEKTRYPSGEWQLGFFYDWLYERAGFMTAEEEVAFMKQIDRWKTEYPDSITWRILLARSYYDRAWGHRGSGFVDTVSAEGWQGYHDYMEKAWDVLDEAASVKEVDPEYYSLRSTLTMEAPRSNVSPPQTFVGALIRIFVPSLTTDRERGPFLRGVAVEPLYYPLYYARTRHLLPRWGGSQEDMLRFAERSADDTKELAGDTLYAVIASKVARWEGKEDYLAYEFDWPRIQRGYDDILKAYPESWWRLNQYCWLAACIYDDRTKAGELFERLDGSWDGDVWDTWSRYAAFRDWAQHDKPYPGPSPLEVAILDDNYRAADRALESGADPNATDLDGDSLLRLAVVRNRSRILARMLEAGANPNIKLSDGRRLIEYALAEPNGDELGILLDHGMLPDPDADAYWTPLATAISWERYEYVGILLEAGANPNGATTHPGGPLLEAVRRSKPEIARQLLDHGADPNVANENGWTPLFGAADVKSLELAQMLVERGADVNAREPDGWSIFHMATKAGAIPVLEFLLEQNPDGVHFVTNGGRTLLHQAAKGDNVELVQFLLERGLDINAIETESGMTPVGLAVKGKHDAVAAYLREHGGTERP